MYTFSELLKQIRKESGLSQKDLAMVLGVSTVLITMVETKQKEVSKSFIKKLADKLDVSPTSVTPFIFSGEKSNKKLNALEKKLVRIGENLQIHLINRKARNLKKYFDAK